MLKKRITPRISETNLAKHIGHHAIPIWFEEGFADLIRLFVSDQNDDPGIVIVNLNIDFIKEMYLGDDVEITTAVKEIGNSSFVLQQKVYQKQSLCARGTVTFIHFDYSTKKAKTIPDDIRLKLEQHLIDR